MAGRKPKGHNKTCKCPVCRNQRKGRKSRKSRR